MMVEFHSRVPRLTRNGVFGLVTGLVTVNGNGIVRRTYRFDS